MRFPLRPRLLRLRRALRGGIALRDATALLAMVGGLVALEVLGRRAAVATDGGDALFVVALIGVVSIAGLVRSPRHFRGWPSIRQLGKDASQWIGKQWPKLGIDFTDDPTTVEAEPVFVKWFRRGLLGAALCFVAWTVWGGTTLRALIAPRFYVLHLAGLALTWSVLLMLAGLGALLAWVLARHVLWLSGRDEPARRSMLMAGWFTMLVGFAFATTVEVAVLCGVASVGVALAMPRLVQIPRLTLLWRTGDGRVLAAASWRLIAQLNALPLGLIVLIVTMALGATWSWWPAPESMTPITDGLAHLAMWLCGPLFLVLSLIIVADLRRLADHDPARACPTTVHMEVATADEDTGQVESLFAARGWATHFVPTEPAETDVRLRLVDSPMPRPLGRWPLAVSERALHAPELLDLIARRDVVQRRRIFRRRMEKLLKDIRSRPYEHGEGFWIAPHLWYVAAATRDTGEEDLSEDGLQNELGTPYALLFPLPVRHHIYLVLKHVQVNLILLEDGVSWAAFRRVMDRVFEHYDRNRGRIEGRHFAGVPGVRVILHDLEPGGNLGVKGYPEPDYEDIARGRILHIFKDRGGPEDELEPMPSEDTGILVNA